MYEQVLVIGAGNWGRNLVRTFYELNALYGVVEADEGLRIKLSEEYPGIHIFRDYRDGLNSDASCVAIATPVHTHYRITLDALIASKDVFIEKPITLSSLEAMDLIQIAEEKQLILMVGHLLLYQPAIRELKSQIESGTIGDIVSIHQERMKLGRVRSVENVLWSFGVHDIAVILYLIGKSPTKIYAHGYCSVQNNIEDDVYLHLNFNEQKSAHIHNSWLWPEMKRKLVVIGTKAMIVFDEDKQTLTLHHKGIDQDLNNCDNGTEMIFKGNEQPLKLECIHFLNCINERVPPISDGRNGLAVVQVLEAATKQLQGGGSNE